MEQRLRKLTAQWREKAGPALKKLRYPALILLVGLLLILLPARKSSEDRAAPVSEQTIEEESGDPGTTDAAEAYRQWAESQLTAILSRVEGAGRVEVMLTLKNGGAVQYQSNLETSSQSDGQGVSESSRSSTVILSRSGAYDEAAVVQTDYPVFRGALIVSEGADNAAVRLALTDAVSVLLGLGTDKITVVKMK